eukprot:scaffold16880_cov126-Isochrysis_galbana.AAC.4
MSSVVSLGNGMIERNAAVRAVISGVASSGSHIGDSRKLQDPLPLSPLFPPCRCTINAVSVGGRGSHPDERTAVPMAGLSQASRARVHTARAARSSLFGT